MTEFSPDVSARLIKETREDDARMTEAPWIASNRPAVFKTAPYEANTNRWYNITSAAVKLDDVLAIARLRNNARPLADQLEAAVREVAKLMTAVENLTSIAVGKVSVDLDRDALRAELGRLQDVLGHLRGISDLDGRPCELCVHANGTYVRRCSMHAEIDGLRAEIDRLTAYEREFTDAARALNAARVPLSESRQLAMCERVTWLNNAYRAAKK